MKANKTLEEQYKKQGSKCIYCQSNTPYEKITRDHLHPVSKGNTLIDNKVFACAKCNVSKGNMTIEEFRNNILNKILSTLRHVVNSNWKISKSQATKFRYYCKVFTTCNKIIKNGNKPEIIFT